MVTAPTPEAIARAKVVIANSLNKQKIEPVVQLVQNGYPIGEPIADCGVTILMNVAAAGDAAMLNKVLELGPEPN